MLLFEPAEMRRSRREARFDRMAMISARFHPVESSRTTGSERKGRRSMGSLTSGTMAGTGSFRCQGCGYVLTLTSLDALRDCPDCGGHDFVRASLFNATPPASEDIATQDPGETHEWVARAK